MNVTFSDKIEIFNYTRYPYSYFHPRGQSIDKHCHVQQEYKFIRPAGSVYIYKTSLFVVILCTLFDCLEFFLLRFQ
jgi:hypothetical protein